jgi:antitoxin (DNA-binding transcriptional repressor) of toxin-antitoxin stability system
MDPPAASGLFGQQASEQHTQIDLAFHVGYVGAMQDVTISELRDHLSEWLRRVERGERVRVKRRDEVIAVLAPPTRDDAAVSGLEERLARLEREGVLRRGSGPRPAWLDALEVGTSDVAVQVLLADREEDL